MPLSCHVRQPTTELKTLAVPAGVSTTYRYLTHRDWNQQSGGFGDDTPATPHRNLGDGWPGD